ncbi:hypothetical protein NQ315_005863 [Exocentrus adspersus]|uniref:Uncharacterized protein n=1 Tax=Exocentrus adspersus TaxID=1586481 RepID=A0AAV8VT19_9CUCU|nr:hypothetical protein NQ315_005863 [Exocentrus adspersus]
MDHGEGRAPGLDAIRALHQTVVALRAALEESRSEILELKSKVWPVDAVEEALRSLTIENHVLRRKVLNYWDLEKSDKAIATENATPHEESDVPNLDPDKQVVTGNPEEKVPRNSTENLQQLESIKKIYSPYESPQLSQSSGNLNLEQHKDQLENINATFIHPQKKRVTIISPKRASKKTKRKIEATIKVKAVSVSTRQISKSLESLTVIKSPLESSKKLSFSKTFSFSNLATQVKRDFNFDINQDFSMTDKKGGGRKPRETDLLEETSIAEESQCPENDLEQAEEVDDIELIFTTDDTKESDFKEQLVSIDAGESTQEASNILQLPLSDGEQNIDSSDRELDDDVFNDNFENENQENTNFQSLEMKRGNSQLYDSKSDNSINQEKSLKSYYSLQDSSFENKSLEKDESFDRFDDRARIVETDISKCGIHDVEYAIGRRNTCPNPLQYRPLLHREALSKGLASGKKSRPILTHSNAIRKESGAQTDISALPGSSWRSESSLANKTRLAEHFTTLPSKFPLPGSRLRLSEKTVEARRVLLSDIGFTSMVPELSRSADHLFPPNLKPTGQAPAYGQFLRTTDLYSPGCTSQKFSWAAAASPSDCSQTQSRYSSMYPLPSPPAPSRRCSAPVSPSRKALIKSTPSKVKFANGSLPELRSDWTTTVDSGDSTDSLVEEAENYLPMLKKSVPRRASAPEPSRDNVPPSGWQPFLPRISRDLKPDHWVKVITPEGRVRGGRRCIKPI